MNQAVVDVVKARFPATMEMILYAVDAHHRGRHLAGHPGGG